MRSTILRTAVDLFAYRGYHHTTLDDIAAEIDVTKGAIYYHFKKKSEILHTIHTVFMDNLISKARARQAEPWDPQDEVRAIARDVLWNMEHLPNYVRVFFEEIRELDPDQWADVRSRMNTYEAHVVETFRRGVEAGSFRPMPDRLAEYALFGMLAWSYQWYPLDGLTFEETAEGLTEVFLFGALGR